MRYVDGETVTIKEVARHAGVSIATVSRVLNGGVGVSIETREKVYEAVTRLGYTRNEVARSLKVRHTRTIGILAPEFSNSFFMEVLESMERVFASQGYTMVVCSSNNSIEQERQKLKVMAERTVDGLVVIPVSDESVMPSSDRFPQIPLVLLDRTLPSVSMDMVLTDNLWGSREATRALVADGFTRIGFIGGDLHVPTARERYLGYCQAMEEAGFAIEPEYVFCEGLMDNRQGVVAMQRIFERPDHPEAFFVANDMLHLGSTTWLVKQGIGTGEIVFASFDYMSYSPLLKYCRYAVCQPLEKIGDATATLLLQRMAHDWDDFPRQIMFRPQVKTMGMQ
jgi:LacI family transcriptional regulator